jgi:hypothetical protein
MSEFAPRLPAGYEMDRSDPDVLILRRCDGSMVAAFSLRGVVMETVEEAAWGDCLVRSEAPHSSAPSTPLSGVQSRSKRKGNDK